MRSFLTASILAALCTFSFSQEDSSTAQAGSTGADYTEAAESVAADLKAALEELATLRKGIAAEKPGIAKEANQIAADLREARRKADIARTRKDSIEAEFSSVEKDLKTWRDEKLYLESLLGDFQKSFEASQLPGTKKTNLRAADLESQLSLLEQSLQQLQTADRVRSLTREVVGDEGVLLPGTLIEAGPVRWFLSEDESKAGIVTLDPDLRPRLVEGTVDRDDLKALLAGSPSSPAFDPTLGTAVALTESKSSLLEHIQKGGFWIYPILLLALIALLAAIAKAFQLRKIQTLPSHTVQAVMDALNAGKIEEARNLASEIRHPSRQILERGIERIEQSGTPTRDDLEESLYEKFLEAQPPLQRSLPLIAIASATAPLLGLLGTVTGMIETFRLINIFGTGDAKSLASGISEALVTTEFGLIVAIPSLILHALLSRKVQGIKSAMEMTSLAFLNGVQLAEPKEKKA